MGVCDSMRWSINIFLQVLLVSCSTGCGTDDCSCGDWYYDNCHNPSPSLQIHVDNLPMCSENCKLFATMGQCSFFIFDLFGNQDENCVLYSEPPETLLNSCGVVGQPLYNTGGEELSIDNWDFAVSTVFLLVFLSTHLVSMVEVQSALGSAEMLEEELVTVCMI